VPTAQIFFKHLLNNLDCWILLGIEHYPEELKSKVPSEQDVRTMINNKIHLMQISGIGSVSPTQGQTTHSSDLDVDANAGPPRKRSKYANMFDLHRTILGTGKKNQIRTGPVPRPPDRGGYRRKSSGVLAEIWKVLPYVIETCDSIPCNASFFWFCWTTIFNRQVKCKGTARTD